MKKFNPEKEIEKLNKSKAKGATNSSKMSNLFIPILVVGCSFMAMTAVTFSAYLEQDEKETYKVHIDIINGDEEVYERQVLEGAFSDTITSNNSFGSIECTSGNLNYDPITGTISTPYLNRNTSCIIAFMDDGVKNIEPSNLGVINDNRGVSHYYKADQEDNYVLIKGQMYRIIRINGDGSIRIMLNDNILSASYGEKNTYQESNVKEALENWYINNFGDESYVVESDFDISNYDEVNSDDLVNLEGYYLSKVGTLSVREAKIITEETNTNYLTSPYGIYLSNGHGFNEVYAFKNNEIVSIASTEALSIRPVININAKLIGRGTKNNPYTIEQ